MITDIPGLLRALAGGEIRFILVGGVAAVAHGSARLTQDVDVVYSRGEEDIRRLAAALAPFRPYPRGAPPGLPFQWDERTIRNGLNFTLQTTLGAIDLLGEIAGGVRGPRGARGDPRAEAVTRDVRALPARPSTGSGRAGLHRVRAVLPCAPYSYAAT